MGYAKIKEKEFLKLQTLGSEFRTYKLKYSDYLLSSTSLWLNAAMYNIQNIVSGVFCDRIMSDELDDIIDFIFTQRRFEFEEDDEKLFLYFVLLTKILDDFLEDAVKNEEYEIANNIHKLNEEIKYKLIENDMYI